MGDPNYVSLDGDDEIYGLVEVDNTPLQHQLEKNKESLKMKLMMRRPMNTLVEQGLMPEYKTSPSLHEQRTKLERAKMGDMLKAKIASRPERSELVHRHILEDVRPDVDPSLCERQRQLKRAKLADSLATQLSHRPGPLELIQKNILHTDDPVEQAVKQGTIQFRPTTEGVPSKPVPFPDDSGDGGALVVPGDGGALVVPLTESNNGFVAPPTDSDNGFVAPLKDSRDGGFAVPLTGTEKEFVLPLRKSEKGFVVPLTDSNNGFVVPRTARSESLGDISPGINAQLDLHQLSRSGSLGGSGSDLIPGYQLPSTPTASLTDLACLSSSTLQREAPGKDKKKWKQKSKPITAPKPRTIKFHEYKGPETSLKRKVDSDKKMEETTQYDLLLQQQQLFLQWQLENQNKFPQILLPAVGKVDNTGRTSIMSLGTMSSGTSSTSSSVPSPASSMPGTPRATTPRASTPIRFQLTPQDVNHATSLLNKLDDMKVTDLKLELKKRNLTVSGPKPILVERLRPVLEAVIDAGRKQFQQPYKQISIPPGGLIILKPSPNSQLLTKPEPNSETAPLTPAPMHEGSPEQYSAPSTPFSPCAGMLSPSGSVLSVLSDDNSSQLEDLLRETSPALHNTGLDFNLQLMESDEFQPPPTPPPPPPPPPPKLPVSSAPKPLPAPPGSTTSVSSVSSSPFQFLPPQKTKQHIQLAKAQLEAQLGGNVNVNSSPSVRAGPKGQFIWPPVSVQSSQGTVSIRATRPGPQSSSTPVSQLAAVFSSQSQSMLTVNLPQEPLPPSELGMSLTPAGRHEANSQESLYQLPPSELPTTLPTPGPQQPTSKPLNEFPESSKSSTEGIIRRQQDQIEKLQAALNRSQEQLISQQTMLKVEQEQNRSESSSMKQLLAHQLQNKQLAAQIHQLQEIQSKQVQEEQTAARQQMKYIIKEEQTAARQQMKYIIIQDQNTNIEQIKKVEIPVQNGQSSHQDSMDDVLEILMKSGDLPEYKPPPPPPPPAKDMFPQLDLADISFDFGGPDLGNSQLDHQDMDVDQDVADWLDSLDQQTNPIYNHNQSSGVNLNCEPNVLYHSGERDNQSWSRISN